MKQFWWYLKLRLLWEIETSVSQNTPSWTHVSKIKVLNCQQNCCALVLWKIIMWSDGLKFKRSIVHYKYLMYHDSYSIFLWILRINESVTQGIMKKFTLLICITKQSGIVLDNKRYLGHIWNMVPFSLSPCQPYLSDKSNQFFSKETFISGEMCYFAV